MLRRALIISGGIFHPFDETSKALAAIFAEVDIGADITSDVEAGLESLHEYDLLVVNTLRWRMQGEKYDPHRDEWFFSLSKEGRSSIEMHLACGGGIFALHTASICFDDWDLWAEILGGSWVWGQSHHPEQAEFDVCIADGEHPIARGLPDFRINDEVYSDMNLSPDCRPILRSSKDTGEQPLLWARMHDNGRIVYDALGHDEVSLAEPTHKRIVERAALWAIGRSDAEIQAR